MLVETMSVREALARQPKGHVGLGCDGAVAQGTPRGPVIVCVQNPGGVRLYDAVRLAGRARSAGNVSNATITDIVSVYEAVCACPAFAHNTESHRNGTSFKKPVVVVYDGGLY